MSTITRTRRSREDWRRIAQEILPEIQQDGKSVESFRGKYGSNLEAIRVELARLGYGPDGQEAPFKEITASSEKVLAKRVAARRRDGAPWWRIQAETGKSYSYLTGLMPQYGYSPRGESTGNGSSAEAA